jgi:pyruvate-formate lyase
VRPLLKTFIRKGGHIFQGNIVSVDRVRAALAHFHEPSDLMLRVAGYSARFTELSPATQTEIIARHQCRGFAGHLLRGIHSGCISYWCK